MIALTIGEVARLAAVNPDTIRYYERRGILPKPCRRPSGYREYGTDTVQAIRFVKRALELGFTLTEIQELLRFRHNDGTTTCAEVLSAAVVKIEDIDRKLRSLTAIRRALGVRWDPA